MLHKAVRHLLTRRRVVKRLKRTGFLTNTTKEPHRSERLTRSSASRVWVEPDVDPHRVGADFGIGLHLPQGTEGRASEALRELIELVAHPIANDTRKVMRQA